MNEAGLGFVVSHPFHGEAVKWMGHPAAEAVMDLPKLFLDTNVCVSVANGLIPSDEWRKVRAHIEANYSYQISFVTLKELFAKISRGKDEFFEKNTEPLRVLCGFLQKQFLPYPAVFALRKVLGLTSVARKGPIPEEELYETVCKAILQGTDKAQLKAGAPYPDKPGGIFWFDLDHFDRHENKPQMEHLGLLQGMRDGRVDTPDPVRLAAFTMEDCCRVADAESCSRLANALSAAYLFSSNLGKVSKNNQARLEKRLNDWGDIMQLYYLCDESMHFLTIDEKCRNQTRGSKQQQRILLYRDLANSL